MLALITAEVKIIQKYKGFMQETLHLQFIY
jgi:hypothetical protein